MTGAGNGSNANEDPRTGASAGARIGDGYEVPGNNSTGPNGAQAQPAKLVAQLAALFAGGQQAHGTHGEPDERKPGDLKWRIKGSAKTLREPPTREHWQQHTAGERASGNPYSR